MTTLTNDIAADRILRHFNGGTLLRNDWAKGLFIESDDPVQTGYERACLLAAMVPEVGTDGDISKCPASLLPKWLAVLTPKIDDRVSTDKWTSIITRFAECVRGSSILDDAAWDRLHASFRLIAVREARSHVPETWIDADLRSEVIAAVDAVIEIMIAEANGEAVDEDRRAEASWAAAGAARAAGAAGAAKAAAMAAARAAMAAAEADAAWDRMVSAWLDEWEAAIDASKPAGDGSKGTKDE